MRTVIARIPAAQRTREGRIAESLKTHVIIARQAKIAGQKSLAKTKAMVAESKQFIARLKAPQRGELTHQLHVTEWQELSTNQLVRLKRRYDDAYTAGKPLVSDREYDALVVLITKLDPKRPELAAVGSAVAPAGSKRVKLPIVVGSLDKCRPNDVAGWMRDMEKVSGKQTRWIVMPKFDGASLLLHYNKEVHSNSWTRGRVEDGADGEESRGINVTATSKHVQGVIGRLRQNKLYDTDTEYLVRGEVVMHRSIFREHYFNQPSGLGKIYVTPRNLVTGLMNRLDPAAVKLDLQRCTFVALQLFRKDAKGIWRRPQDAYKEWLFLSMMGFTTAMAPVRYSEGHTKIYKWVKEGAENLRGMLPVHEASGSIGELAYWDVVPTPEQVVERMQAIFKAVDITCDGIVVQPLNNKVFQDGGEQLARRPNFVRAIKLEARDQETYQGKVGAVLWKVSKRGLLKPRVQLAEPIDVEGVKVEYATANNAAFVKKWGLRSGRPLKFVRSGDVIPRITYVFDKTWKSLTVLHKGKLIDGPGISDPGVAASLPQKCPSCGSKLRWTDTKIDLVCANEACAGRHGQNVVSFFKTLGVDDVAAGTVEHLMTAGLNTVAKIMTGATPERLIKLEKYQERKAKVVSDAVASAMKGKPLAQVMHASGLFAEDAHSLGSTRLQAIIDGAGEGLIRRGTVAEIRAKLSRSDGKKTSVSGLGVESLNLFLDTLPIWRAFYAPIEKFHAVPSGPKTLKDVVVCFTGFRDAEMESYLVAHGGRVSGMSGKVTMLFAASAGSAKCQRADKLGIPIIEQGKAWSWLKSKGE